jgi:hypothetical protein
LKWRAAHSRRSMLLSKFEWVRCRVKCGRKPGEANT